MSWLVRLHDEFEPEFAVLTEAVQDDILARMAALQELGPQLGRPRADTLKGSRHVNMKELRFYADHGIWRVTYAFDPTRTCIVLAAGNKSGRSERRFYQKLIAKSDARFDAYLRMLSSGRSGWAKHSKS